MITKIRRLFFNGYVAAPLMAAIMFVSCKKDNPGDVSVASVNQQVSGETIFRAVMFGEGDIAKKIPVYDAMLANLNSLTPDEKKMSSELVTEIVTSIRANNPSFFSNFEKEVKSKDYYRIDLAIKSAKDVVTTFMENSPKYGKYFAAGKAVAAQIPVKDYDLTTENGLKQYEAALAKKVTSKINDSEKQAIYTEIFYPNKRDLDFVNPPPEPNPAKTGGNDIIIQKTFAVAQYTAVAVHVLVVAGAVVGVYIFLAVALYLPPLAPKHDGGLTDEMLVKQLADAI